MYINNGKWPLYYGDIQLENPEWNLGDPLPPGWQEVKESEIPSATNTQVTYEDEPVEIDGVLYRNWKVRDLSDEEIADRDTKTKLALELGKLGLSSEDAINILLK